MIGEALSLEGIAVSAGFAATLSIYMISTHRPDYVKLGRAIQISIVLFATSAILIVADASLTWASFVFAIGWVTLVTILVAAALSPEFGELRASIRHSILWSFQYGKFARVIGINPQPSTFKKERMTFGFLKSVLKSDMWRGVSIAVIGMTETYPRHFAYQVLYEGLKAGENAIYVNTHLPSSVITGELNLPTDFRSRLHVIDCYSPIFGLGEVPTTGPPEKYRADSVREIHSSIRKIRCQIGFGEDFFKTRIVYDGIELLDEWMGESRLKRYIMHCIGIENSLGWVSVYVLHPNYSESRVYKLIRNSVDCIIELECDVMNGRKKYSMRFAKMPGVDVITRKIPYEVNTYDKWLRLGRIPLNRDFIQVRDTH